MKKLLTVVVLALLLASNVIAEGLIFETVAEGDHCGHNNAQNYVIQNLDKWKQVWEMVVMNPFQQQIPIEELIPPDVNFKTTMVIAVFMGQQSNGGYDVRITSVFEKMGVLNIRYDYIVPKPDMFVPTWLTQPYHIVRCDKVDFTTVKFIEERK